jgi:hypothetical protein
MLMARPIGAEYTHIASEQLDDLLTFCALLAQAAKAADAATE